MCNKTCGAAHNAQETIMEIFRTTQLAAPQQHKCVIRSCKYTVQTLVEKQKIKWLSLKAAFIFWPLGGRRHNKQTHTLLTNYQLIKFLFNQESCFYPPDSSIFVFMCLLSFSSSASFGFSHKLVANFAFVVEQLGFITPFSLKIAAGKEERKPWDWTEE